MKKLIVITVMLVLVGLGVKAQEEAGGFLPNREVITLGNAHQLQEIGVLGVGDIYDVAWSHDGQMAALASSIGISIYDAADWSKPVKILDSDGASVEIYFSPDDSQIIAFPASDAPWLAPEPGDLWTFQVATGERLTLVNQFTNGVDSLGVSPDGGTIATVEQDVKRYYGGIGVQNTGKVVIRLWNTSTGNQVMLPEIDGAVYDLQFSPVANQLFLFFRPSSDPAIDQLITWDIQNETLADLWELERGKYSQIALSGDGQTLALPLVDSDFNYLRTELWDVESKTLRQTATITYDALAVEGWLVSKDFKRSFTGEVWLNQDASLILTKEYTDPGIAFYIWDIDTGLNVFKREDINIYPAPVDQFVLSSSGSMLATQYDNSVLSWEANTQAKNILIPGAWYFEDAVLSPTDEFLAVLPVIHNEDRSQVFDLRSGTRLKLPHESYRPIAFTADGKTAALEQDGIIYLWDVESDTVAESVGVYEDTIDNAIFSPDGEYLVVSVRPSWENYAEDDEARYDTVRIYSAETGDLVSSERSYQGKNEHLMFSSDSSILMTDISLWDFQKLLAEGGVDSAKLHNELDDGRYGLNNAISADGRLLATVDARDDDWNDTSITHIYDLSSSQLLHTLDAHHGNISALDFSPDGTLLVSGSQDFDAEVRDNSVRVWDVSSGEMLKQLETQHNDFIRDVGFSSDGTFIFSLRGGCPCEGQWGSDSAVRIWGMPT